MINKSFSLERDDELTFENSESVKKPNWQYKIDRRTFVQLMGAAILITVTRDDAEAQSRQRTQASVISARLRIDRDGKITVMAGKIEEGQGSRTQLSQAAAEELRVSPDRIQMILADTALVPDDGMTAGSRTTPRNVPEVRRAAAAAREILTGLAADHWETSQRNLKVQDGTITNTTSNEKVTYGELVELVNAKNAFDKNVPSDISLTSIDNWKVMGTSVPKPTGRDIVTGRHRYPSDIIRPGMLYGKILRPPSYGATLTSIDLSRAEAMKDVVVFREGQFVGCAAPTVFLAKRALEVIAETAKWETVPHPSSNKIYQYLRENTRPGRRNDNSSEESNRFVQASKVLKETYHTAYIQHTPMEPRAAVAEWNDGHLTTWAGIDYPQRIQNDLARAFNISRDKVRVIVPDMGGGFGGKHTGQAAEEAARLSKAAGCPVSLRWTREEEFTWAYFRPAAVIDCQAGLNQNGSIIAWNFININSGSSAIETPYKIPDATSRYIASNSPLSQGPYRCLAATANNFARECFMDELASAANVDPLVFRLSHLENQRLRAVLETATKRFDWTSKMNTPERGFGLACGTEKGSVVAACVEVAIDLKNASLEVRKVCEAFECGPIQNPDNLLSQVQGCIMMGLGGALREEIKFENGQILNASFSDYLVPRFKDVPEIEVHLVNKTDIPSAGAGETPIIAIAPAISNAVFAATGIRIRSMPILPALKTHIKELNKTAGDV